MARNLLILVGYGSSGQPGGDVLERFADAVSQRVQVPTCTAFLDASPSVGECIQQGVLDYQPDAVVVLPVFVGASMAKQQNVRMIVEAANERGFDAAIQYGNPLGAHAGVIAAYRDRVADALRHSTAAATLQETALLVVARGSHDPESNAAVYPVARLLYEKTACGAFEVAFCGTATPDIQTGIQRCIQAGARQVIVVPYVLYDTAVGQAVQAQTWQTQADYPDVTLIACSLLDVHNAMIEAVSERYQDALQTLAQQPAGTRSFGHSHAHGHNGGYNGITNITAHLQALLPPRYQTDTPVSAAPMSAADLIFDAQGQVAWDQIWGDFCDLALAGGPPHRGTLLEPVDPAQIQADPQGYQTVWTELERGIRMITGLPVVSSESPGWIGVQCDDEAMALWLLRAIVIENVSVRREGCTLFFPVGPHFRLEQEIKNIITVIAKTHHYWQEHITSQ